jgi:hypothetical protein
MNLSRESLGFLFVSRDSIFVGLFGASADFSALLRFLLLFFPRLKFYILLTSMSLFRKVLISEICINGKVIDRTDRDVFECALVEHHAHG